MTIYVIVLFVILTPGIFLSLPTKGSHMTKVIVHSILFAAVYHLTHKVVWDSTKEGFANTICPDGDSLTGSSCCPSDTSLIGSSCCPVGTNLTGTKCCPTGSTLTGSKCCPTGSTLVGNKCIKCPSGKLTSNTDKCCPNTYSLISGAYEYCGNGKGSSKPTTNSTIVTSIDAVAAIPAIAATAPPPPASGNKGSRNKVSGNKGSNNNIRRGAFRPCTNNSTTPCVRPVVFGDISECPDGSSPGFYDKLCRTNCPSYLTTGTTYKTANICS